MYSITNKNPISVVLSKKIIPTHSKEFIPISNYHKILALSKLISSLQDVEKISSSGDDIDFLKGLLQSKELNALVNVHSKVAKICKDDRLIPTLSTSTKVSCISFIFFFFSNIYFTFCFHRFITRC